MDSNLPKIAICGPGRSGKDTAASWFASHTPLRYCRSTSEVIAPHVAGRLGLSVEEAFSRRHDNRQFWFDVGNELRDMDPAYLVRESLKDGEISVGMRNRSEVIAVRDAGIVDLIVWIDRDVPADPTMEFGAEMCDVIILNRGTVEEFHQHLEALARWARLLEVSGESRRSGKDVR